MHNYGHLEVPSKIEHSCTASVSLKRRLSYSIAITGNGSLHLPPYFGSVHYTDIKLMVASYFCELHNNTSLGHTILQIRRHTCIHTYIHEFCTVQYVQKRAGLSCKLYMKIVLRTNEIILVSFPKIINI